MTLDLESIEQRATAATTGPWEYEFTSPKMGGTQWQLRAAGKPGIRMVVSEYQHGPDNAEFIAHAREDIPALISEVERLQAIVERVRKLHAPEVQTVSVPVFDEFDSPTQTDTYCAGCGGWGSSQKLHRLCPTVRALEES